MRTALCEWLEDKAQTGLSVSGVVQYSVCGWGEQQLIMSVNSGFKTLQSKYADTTAW